MSVTVLLKGAPSQPPLAERLAGEGGGAEARQSLGVGWGKGGQADAFRGGADCYGNPASQTVCQRGGPKAYSVFLRIGAFV